MNPLPMLKPKFKFPTLEHRQPVEPSYITNEYQRCDSTIPPALEPRLHIEFTNLSTQHNHNQFNWSGAQYKERTFYDEGVLKKFTGSDTPEPWGLFFQDNATPQMEGLEELHNNIMFYLAVTLFAVSWIMVSIVLNYRKNKARISNKYVNHGTLVELIWTISPALILILIAFPSFKLLYLMDEVIDPSLVIYGGGHQWYWSYQYPDFTNYAVENTGVSLRAQYIYNP